MNKRRETTATPTAKPRTGSDHILRAPTPSSCKNRPSATKRKFILLLGSLCAVAGFIFVTTASNGWTQQTMGTEQFASNTANSNANDHDNGINRIHSERSNTPSITDASAAHPINDDFPTNNLRIAFLGDSLTRYTYLSLVHYLKKNEWPKNRDRFMTMSPSLPSQAWNEFFQYTNAILQPEEACDCYRNWEGAFNADLHVENRYYVDVDRNVSIAFFNRFGQHPFHGHWNRDDVRLQHRRQRDAKDHGLPLDLQSRPFTWKYLAWPNFIVQYVRPFRPDFVVFNQGHWSGHDLRKSNVVRNIRDALNRTGITGIYRTTTPRRDGKISGNHDGRVCSIIQHCWNVSWIDQIPKDGDHFIDPIHFHAEINNRMVRQLMEMIRDIQGNAANS